MYLVPCHRRAREPPGNLDTTVSYMGGSLGCIWSGGLGPVAENKIAGCSFCTATKPFYIPSMREGMKRAVY